ncbi:hypothetical protein M9H77_22877 [Catharanthus roseus]|uniref:Uncharacterized protein n=1 Tax=Catharanthus roseus TaxID=4058 RepID=A0ACC0ATW1_CATRO|nr:hypothetical protein M9H77_22877 [Catharanthus roseus]
MEVYIITLSRGDTCKSLTYPLLMILLFSLMGMIGRTSILILDYTFEMIGIFGSWKLMISFLSNPSFGLSEQESQLDLQGTSSTTSQLWRSFFALITDISKARNLNFTPSPSTDTTTAIRLKQPSNTHSLVLNVDGASKGNPRVAVARGVLRHIDGSFIRRFSHYLGDKCSNSFAEVMAILFRISMAAEMGFSSFLLQSDSFAVVPMIHHFLALLRIHIKHVFREPNHVADSLANVGHNLRDRQVFCGLTALPRFIHRLILLDQQGVSYLGKFRLLLLGDTLHGVPRYMIPQEISYLLSLKHLSMSYNPFGGKVPTNLNHCRELTLLESLDNELVGNIPNQHSSLTKMSFMLREITISPKRIRAWIANLLLLYKCGITKTNATEKCTYHCGIRDTPKLSNLGNGKGSNNHCFT